MAEAASGTIVQAINLVRLMWNQLPNNNLKKRYRFFYANDGKNGWSYV
jgi:hypothetical protein